MYELSKRWTLSALFVYSTGNAVTFPSGKYDIEGNPIFYYTERNGYRMPPPTPNSTKRNMNRHGILVYTMFMAERMLTQ